MSRDLLSYGVKASSITKTGTIKDIDYANDKATVTVSGTDYADIPIHYHCSDDDAKSDTHSGMSSAFEIDDEVIVMFDDKGTTAHVIYGFTGDIKECGLYVFTLGFSGGDIVSTNHVDETEIMIDKPSVPGYREWGIESGYYEIYKTVNVSDNHPVYDPCYYNESTMEHFSLIYKFKPQKDNDGAYSLVLGNGIEVQTDYEYYFGQECWEVVEFDMSSHELLRWKYFGFPFTATSSLSEYRQNYLLRYLNGRPAPDQMGWDGVGTLNGIQIINTAISGWDYLIPNPYQYESTDYYTELLNYPGCTIVVSGMFDVTPPVFSLSLSNPYTMTINTPAGSKSFSVAKTGDYPDFNVNVVVRTKKDAYAFRVSDAMFCSEGIYPVNGKTAGCPSYVFYPSGENFICVGYGYSDTKFKVVKYNAQNEIISEKEYECDYSYECIVIGTVAELEEHIA